MIVNVIKLHQSIHTNSRLLDIYQSISNLFFDHPDNPRQCLKLLKRPRSALRMIQTYFNACLICDLLFVIEDSIESKMMDLPVMKITNQNLCFGFCVCDFL